MSKTQPNPEPDKENSADADLPPSVPGGTDYFEKGAKQDTERR